MAKFDNSDDSVVVIIGSGAGGGTLANELCQKGIKVVTSAMAREAVDNGDSVTVRYEVDGKEETIDADYVMVTVGRRPNTNDMGLEQAGVEMTDRGLISVDKQGRTNVPSIYAIGDIVR